MLEPGGPVPLLPQPPAAADPEQRGGSTTRSSTRPSKYWRVGAYLSEDVTVEEVERGVFHPVRAPAALHRYLNALIDAGLVLTRIEEPAPAAGVPRSGERVRRRRPHPPAAVPAPGEAAAALTRASPPPLDVRRPERGCPVSVVESSGRRLGGAAHPTSGARVPVSVVESPDVGLVVLLGPTSGARVPVSVVESPDVGLVVLLGPTSGARVPVSVVESPDVGSVVPLTRRPEPGCLFRSSRLRTIGPVVGRSTLARRLSEYLVIAGLSGAGRSQAANDFEDLGWFVIDNLPVETAPQDGRARRDPELADQTGVALRHPRRPRRVRPARSDRHHASQRRPGPCAVPRGVDPPSSSAATSRPAGGTRSAPSRPLAEVIEKPNGSCWSRCARSPTWSSTPRPSTSISYATGSAPRSGGPTPTSGCQTTIRSFGFKHGAPARRRHGARRALPAEFRTGSTNCARSQAATSEPVRDFVLGQDGATAFLDRVGTPARAPRPCVPDRGQGVPDDRRRLHRWPAPGPWSITEALADRLRVLDVDAIVSHRDVDRVTAVVAIGGGSRAGDHRQGRRHLRHRRHRRGRHIRRRAAAAGRLRQLVAMPAPGDLRRCITTLSGDRERAASMEHRFGAGELANHAVGNLVLAGMVDAGVPFRPGRLRARRLAASARRSPRRFPGDLRPPSTWSPSSSTAPWCAGQVAVKETAGVHRVRVEPVDAHVPAQVVEAIAAADQIVVGPGSLFTSVLAAVAVPAVWRRDRGERSTDRLRLQPASRRDRGAGLQPSANHITALARHGLVPDVVLAQGRRTRGRGPPDTRRGTGRRAVRVGGPTARPRPRRRSARRRAG